jgi:hypothetical protein
VIKNTAFLAAITVFLLAAWLAGELSFLAPYKVALFHEYGMTMAVGTLLLFFNLCAAYYGVARWLFLRDTGRKLMHVDRQLIASEGVHQDVPAEHWSARR